MTDELYLFIVNPSSGAGKGKKIAGLLERLLPEHPRLGQKKAEVILTDRIEDPELSKRLSHADAAIAVGGDGTVSRLAPLLLACERPPALGLIPLGTSNDLARTLGISVSENYANAKTLQRALDLLLDAKKDKLDVFSVNERLLFCNYFSVGFDAAIVRDFDAFRGSGLVRILPAGRLTNNILYFLMGLKNATFHLEPPMEIEYSRDGESGRLKINSPRLAIIASNLPFYAGGCRIGPEARKDDGAFELSVVHNVYEYVGLILTRLIPFMGLPSGIAQYQAREATIRLASPAPSQLDGEKCCEADAPTPSLKISFHRSIIVLIPAPPV